VPTFFGKVEKKDKREGFFRCGRSHFLVQKNFEFFEMYGVFARTRVS